jgi:hypothetical protein
VIGQAAEFIIELQGPAFADTLQEVTLTGSAYSSTTNKYSQTVTHDPRVNLLTDFTNTSSHMTVSLGKTNETYFNVSQFKQVGGMADNASSAQSIAVGPNGGGSTIGDPWMLGFDAGSSGDHNIYHWVNGTFVQVAGGATQIAISPTGTPWVINHAGAIYSWNGSSFVLAPGNACASQIAVGAQGPWILGCHEQTNGYSIYKLQGSSWVQQPSQATKIAIGQHGPWIIQKPGNVAYWNGSNYIQAPGNPCATDIAVAPITVPVNTSTDDVWITGCHSQSTGYTIYQLQGNSFVQIPGEANQISVSPDLGVPWIVDKKGNIYE